MKRLAPLGVTRLAPLGVSRFVPLAMSIILVAAVATTAQIVGPVLYMNETDSMPRGLYVVTREAKRASGFASASDGVRGHRSTASSPRARAPGTIVLFQTPKWVTLLAWERGYLAPGNLFLKTVGATAGMKYCVEWLEPDRGVLTIDEVVAPVFTKDLLGRELPRIEGCYLVPEGYFLPLSTHHERSFDGRYYGVVGVEGIRSDLR